MGKKQSKRLKKLRRLLRVHKLDGYIVPHNDEYQSEQIHPNSNRLCWLTGFSGSAGNAVILRKKAAIFVDGRYTIQAKKEVYKVKYSIHEYPKKKYQNWLIHQLKNKEKIGFDPKLHTITEIKSLKQRMLKKKASLVPIKKNLIDRLWKRSDSEKIKKMFDLKLKFSGQSSAFKIKKIAKLLRKKKTDFLFLSCPESIVWLLNVRGNDLPYTPVVKCMAMIDSKENVDLFIDKNKVPKQLISKLGTKISVVSIDEIFNKIRQRKKTKPKSIILDDKKVSYLINNELKEMGFNIIFSLDPCISLKAIKNGTEINGMRNAHIRDGVALIKFLYWLKNNHETKDELTTAIKIDNLRKKQKLFHSLSFPTISGAGSNSAIIHYHATKKTNKKLKNGDLYLLDSGGQYFDGTTDVTRTVSIGKPSKEQKDRFTRVLKGHISVANSKFTTNTSGKHLDTLARKPLKQVGLDYAHGTGHGVGSFLSVHEGPQSISKYSNAKLYPGMILSNEPGYYKEGEYGIRIENLILIKKIKKMLEFETLTYAPIDINLIDIKLLTKKEIEWLNQYHKKVFSKLSKKLDTKIAQWLKEQTKAI